MNDKTALGVVILVFTLAGFGFAMNYVLDQRQVGVQVDACKEIAKAPVEHVLKKYEVDCRALFEVRLPSKTKGWEKDPKFVYRGEREDWSELYHKVNKAFKDNNRTLMDPISKLTNGWVEDDLPNSIK